MVFKFAPNLSTLFHECKNLTGRYKMASECGFSGVECQQVYDMDISDLNACKVESGLEQVLINTFGGHSEIECGHAVCCKSEFEATFVYSLQIAKELNCKKLHILAGLSMDHLSFEKMEQNYLLNMALAAEKCEKEGIIGVIEPICKETKNNYFLSSFEKAVYYVKTINSPHLRLLLDIYHLQMISGNLTNTIKSVLPYTGHVQISQAPNREEPSAYGEINYPYILSLLELYGYNDWIGLEYFPSVNTLDSFKWIEEYGYQIF